MNEKEILVYLTSDGKSPYNEWFYALRDKTVQAAIRARLARVRIGNFGMYRSVGHGVWELKFYFGAGNRIYYGQDGDQLVILLSGGDKDSQSRDIKKAQEFWADYWRRTHESK